MSTTEASAEATVQQLIEALLGTDWNGNDVALATGIVAAAIEAAERRGAEREREAIAQDFESACAEILPKIASTEAREIVGTFGTTIGIAIRARSEAGGAE